MKVGIIGCGFIGNTLANAIEAMKEIDELYLFDRKISCTEGLASELKKAKAICCDKRSKSEKVHTKNVNKN